MVVQTRHVLAVIFWLNTLGLIWAILLGVVPRGSVWPVVVALIFFLAMAIVFTPWTHYSLDVDLEEMRRAIPHRRPYTLENMQKLLEYIRKFKSTGFPTSQLQGMYQALFEGEVNAQLASIATLGYLGGREDKTLYTLLKGFFADFGVGFDGQLPPWDAEKRDDRRVSAVADLAELYPFIHYRERGDASDTNEN